MLLKKLCMLSLPCSIMRLLMAGIIMGPVYGSLKIWLSTGSGVYVSEENRGSQAVSMTAQRQCDREGRWAGKKGAGGGGGLKETEMEKGVEVHCHTQAPPEKECHLIWRIFLQILDHLLLMLHYAV